MTLILSTPLTLPNPTPPRFLPLHRPPHLRPPPKSKTKRAQTPPFSSASITPRLIMSRELDHSRLVRWGLRSIVLFSIWPARGVVSSVDYVANDEGREEGEDDGCDGGGADVVAD